MSERASSSYQLPGLVLFPLIFQVLQAEVPEIAEQKQSTSAGPGQIPYLLKKKKRAAAVLNHCLLFYLYLPTTPHLPSGIRGQIHGDRKKSNYGW